MIKFTAENKKTGETIEITDMYWFEENYVRDINDDHQWEFTVNIYCQCGSVMSEKCTGWCERDD